MSICVPIFRHEIDIIAGSALLPDLQSAVMNVKNACID
jgi:hypothetical protein